MKPKNCLIFGGSGQIGRYLIRKLTKNNIRVTVVTRNIHQKSYIIKTQGNAGYIDIVEANIYDEKKIRNLFSKSDICVNLIGIIAKFMMEDSLVKLRGTKANVVGRSLVIHEDPDDLGMGGHSDSLTTGHAGKRITCAVIGYSKKMCK